MSWISEVRHDISSIQSTPQELKKFGLTIGGMLLLLCSVAFYWNWWGNAILLTIGVFGLFLIVSGLTVPKLLREIHHLWMGFAVILGSIVSRIILFFVFYSVVTFISITARIFGKKFYIAHNDHQRSTYWIQRDQQKPINYERMS